MTTKKKTSPERMKKVTPKKSAVSKKDRQVVAEMLRVGEAGTASPLPSKSDLTSKSFETEIKQPNATIVEFPPNNWPDRPETTSGQLREEALTLAERAMTLTISDQATYNVAVEELRSVVALRKKITDHHGPLKAAAFNTHRLLCAAESEVLKPVSDAERILKQAVGVWDTEQTRLHNARLRQTQMEDAQRHNEELRKATADAEEKSALEIERLMLEENMTLEEATAVVNPQAVVAQAVEEVPQVRTVVPAAYQKTSGVSTLPPLYSAEVVDIKELCGAVYRGEYSTECVIGNEPVLNGLARTLKDTFKVPGVKLIKTENRVGVTGK